MDSCCDIAIWLAMGCPIRRSVVWRLFATTHGFSQLTASFFVFRCPGSLRVPLFAWPFHNFARKFYSCHVAMPGFILSVKLFPSLLIYFLRLFINPSFVLLTVFKRFALFLLYAIFKVQVHRFRSFSCFLLMKSLRTKQRLTFLTKRIRYRS